MALPVLRVQFLGDFGLVYDGTLLNTVNTSRLQSILAFLILHAEYPQSRQHIAFLLWPDAHESQARNNLRQFLYLLRQALPHPDRFLAADANTVCWKLDEGQAVDVRLFERARREAEAAERQGDTHAHCQALERAISYYGGDLLPSCYDDWITSERDRLRQQCQDAYRKLMLVLEGQREYSKALQTARQLLHLDPLGEGTYVSLMRLHVLNEDYPGAWRVYEKAVETLHRELGAEPGDALRATYERLQNAPETISSFTISGSPAGASIPLIGRQAEWQQLQAAWRRAVSGEAHLALVTGEAGIGKSRLAEELFSWAKRQGFATAYTRSYGAEGRLSLAPVTEWLRSNALRPQLASLDPVWLTEIARLLPELLNEHTNLARPEPITEYGRRQRFFEALARAVLAAPRPLLLSIDDLQWCDQETLDWLHFLLRFKARNALLILGTARSEESPPDHPLSVMAQQLRTEDRLRHIELSPLDAAETAKLAFQIRGHALDTSANVRLFRETEGNPLFVVETVRADMAGALAPEADTSAAPAARNSDKLPPRMYAVIARRIAQLSPPARQAVELGAAIGRAFTLDLLLHAGNEDQVKVTHALDELWQKRIVREQVANVFDFTHDKLRDVAYMETAAPQRRFLHRQIAQALERLYAENLDPASAQVAAQYEQAGQFEQAVPYYRRAGLVAASVYANDDATRLLTRGLELLAQLPPNAKRDSEELNLQLALAPLYTTTKGWASPEAERSLNRALILSDRVGDPARRAETLFALQSMYIVGARHQKVHEIHPEMCDLFVRRHEKLPPFAGLVYAIAAFHMGRIREARERLEQVVAIRDDQVLRNLQASHRGNYLVMGHAYISHAAWCLGYPQAALHTGAVAWQIADEFAEPFNQALAMTYLATLQLWCADIKTFLAHANAVYAFSDEFKVTYYHVWANILVRFAQAWQQPDIKSLDGLRDAIRVFSDTGARVRLPLYFALLAHASLRAGEIDRGLEAIDEGLAQVRQSSEQWWDSEIHRLQGELMWAQGADRSDVEAVFRRALEIAQAQHAKSLELRAATSLARFWQAHSGSAEAKHLLAPLYGWFKEGFDTPDLQTARVLLAQL